MVSVQAARWLDVIDSKHRLQNSNDFRSVRSSGKVYKHPYVILIAAPNNGSYSRIGISVGKSVGGAAQRNLVKRRLRACMYQQLSVIRDGWDIILIARQQSSKAAFSDLQNAVVGLVHKAGILNPVDRLA